MSNEMISVPRALLAKPAEQHPNKADNVFWLWLDSAYRDGSKGEEPRFTKYNMEVAYLAGAQAGQHQSEPVAWYKPHWNGKSAEWRLGAELTDAVFPEMWEPLYTEQPAPVAVVPEPYAWHTEDHLSDKSATTYDKAVADRWIAKGWPVTQMARLNHPQQ